ncbi:uncharacterized protein LOC144633909 isoform X2 [Oculina patagonica]
MTASPGKIFNGTWLTSIILCYSLIRICNGETAGRCGSEQSIFGKALKGHVFATGEVKSPDECFTKCQQEPICQSFNYVINEDICELSNRTKEAKPDNFVPDQKRMYMKGGIKRIPLGSIPTLPAQSCKEIKANEGGQAVSSNSWLDPSGSGEVILAYCDMNTEVADFCVNPRCQNGGTCVTGHVNYTCECSSRWTGAYCEIAAQFHTSTILHDFGNTTFIYDLTQFLDPVLQGHSSFSWTKCYHALSDGWEASTFHSLCDDKGPTLAIIRVNNYIFGGFTSISWRSSICSYAADSQAFIFSLYNTKGYHPVKLTQSGNANVYCPVYRCSSSLVTFGNGYDLKISNLASTNLLSYTRPNCYSPPDGCSYSVECSFFAGSFSFSPSDIEVFFLTAS